MAEMVGTFYTLLQYRPETKLTPPLNLYFVFKCYAKFILPVTTVALVRPFQIHRTTEKSCNIVATFGSSVTLVDSDVQDDLDHQD